MATPKTQRTGTDLAAHLAALPEDRRELAQRVADVLHRATGEDAVLWGAIVGYGTTSTTSSGRTTEWPAVSFAVRKNALALYGLRSGPDADELVDRLGHHGEGTSCLYLKRLEGVDLEVLAQLARLAHDRAADG